MRNTCRKTYLQKLLQFFFFTDIISFKNTTDKLSNNLIVFIFIFTLDWSISVMVTEKQSICWGNIKIKHIKIVCH